MRSFLIRFAKDKSGAHIVELSIAVGLFALVAAFGFFFLGDAVADYFDILRCNFANASTFVESGAPEGCVAP